MEDVLDVYQRPYNQEQPVICMYESSKQHLKEVRVPIPLSPSSFPQPGFTDFFRI